MDKLPLEGVRVLDFTFAWAGPYATMLLAFMGAEVIKVESNTRLDHSRMFSIITREMYDDVNKSTVFNDMNLSKLSVNLNLKDSRSIEIAKRIMKISDIVAENMRPGVMDKLGLGYDVAREVNPNIIYLSSSARGSEGPERSYSGYAPGFGAMGGLSNIIGDPDDPPSMMGGEMDLLSGTASVFAILAALNYRQKTGEGQYIDLSSSEAGSVCIGEVFMDYFMNGKVQTREGNKDGIMAPHNCYPCKGNDRWISIAVETDEEWSSLCNAIGNPEWTIDERFSDAYSRWNNQEELDKLIGEWTIHYETFEVMEILQKAKVAALPSYNSQDLFSDPHLKEREFATKVEHPLIGETVVIAPPWKTSTLPVHVQCGPLFGQHNDYVFGELLGMSKDDISKLVEDNVIF
ncbi:MAG: CoA transferase [Spirochaetota bacterium]|nr:CoA transferase [Spirochaetota bacterium]